MAGHQLKLYDDKEYTDNKKSPEDLRDDKERIRIRRDVV